MEEKPRKFSLFLSLFFFFSFSLMHIAFFLKNKTIFFYFFHIVGVYISPFMKHSDKHLYFKANRISINFNSNDIRFKKLGTVVLMAAHSCLKLPILIHTHELFFVIHFTPNTFRDICRRTVAYSDKQNQWLNRYSSSCLSMRI